jgi:hypothetical protein
MNRIETGECASSGQVITVMEIFERNKEWQLS